jgi:hypothetical protein
MDCPSDLCLLRYHRMTNSQPPKKRQYNFQDGILVLSRHRGDEMERRYWLVRLWAILSACWMGWLLVGSTIGCFDHPDSSLIHPICNAGEMGVDTRFESHLIDFSANDWMRWIVWMFGPPAICLAFIIAIQALAWGSVNPRRGR